MAFETALNNSLNEIMVKALHLIASTMLCRNLNCGFPVLKRKLMHKYIITPIIKKKTLIVKVQNILNHLMLKKKAWLFVLKGYGLIGFIHARLTRQIADSKCVGFADLIEY